MGWRGQAIGHDASGQPLGRLNNKAHDWWTLSLTELGQAVKTSCKLTASPFKTPRDVDDCEPYVDEYHTEVERLIEARSELNDRVYRLFALTPAEIQLLQDEVEH